MEIRGRRRVATPHSHQQLMQDVVRHRRIGFFTDNRDLAAAIDDADGKLRLNEPAKLTVVTQKKNRLFRVPEFDFVRQILLQVLLLPGNDGRAARRAPLNAIDRFVLPYLFLGFANRGLNLYRIAL